MSVRKEDLIPSFLAGLGMAVLYSLWATAVFVARRAAFDSLGVPLGQLVVAYFVGGAFGGALVGFLLPRARRSLTWAAVTGYIAALPFFSMMMLMLLTPQELAGPSALIVPVVGSLVGAGAGIWIWLSENRA